MSDGEGHVKLLSNSRRCGGSLYHGLGRLGVLNAKKRNHGPRRMGCHGSVGNGANCASAASTETPTAHSYGRNQEAFGRRLPIRNCQPAPSPSKVQVVSR